MTTFRSRFGLIRLSFGALGGSLSGWDIEDFCRGDVYGVGIVLWEIYTAQEPGFRGSRLEHIKSVCVEGRRPVLPSESADVSARQTAAEVEYESWVKSCCTYYCLSLQPR